MTRLSLLPHPETPCTALTAIEVDLQRAGPGTLSLRYNLVGDVTQISLPTLIRDEPTDGLWQHTCFEVFLKPSGGAAYYEFNFAPLSQWAAYRFDAYRDGMQPLQAGDPPYLFVDDSKTAWAFQALLDISTIDKLTAGTSARLGLSAVIEQIDGSKSYWALAHAPGKPDFHHDDAFAHELNLTDHP